MILRNPSLLSTLSTARCALQHRQFSCSASRAAKNRIFNSIRRPDDLHTLNLLSSSSSTPLLTFWSTAWCPSCSTVRPLIRELIEEHGVGESEGGIGFVEVEMDSPEIGDLPVQYMIASMPTLMAFSRGEPQVETKVTLPEKMKDRAWIEEWIRTEAKRGGAGGAGGSIFGSWFGKG
ncbi:hypothetical protein EJ05DRAFT_480767 [Pseudovirgaria hyperparasitica]|uniref:Thioredoxin domain-containing protein n=1 Tax=Pseudovirgaria hyperparasitica TaxID=470096 RepID=A0A6A6VUW6_9PEZI|nr:uncharacterized protein EJ05DRAFT_480767 [Pseudovirgaria hyperparasitica]KAF2753057.1 hypothetical protein EJ05DRAFT_480767 [Pseudovirgaria hyperparasitica]